MPALVMFNRHWRVGSDDFVYPSLIGVTFRLGFIAFQVWAYLQVTGHCSVILTEYYLISAFGLTGLTIILQLTLAWLSTRGSILNSAPRRHVATCLMVHMFLTLIETGVTATATYYLFGDRSLECENFAHNYFLVIIAVAWALKGTLLWSVLGALDIWGGKKVKDPRTGHVHSRGFLVRFLSCMFCCVKFNPQDEASGFDKMAVYRLVADTLSGFFEGYDVVSTDMLAAIMLVRARQRRERKELVAAVKRAVENPTAAVEQGHANAVRDFVTQAADTQPELCSAVHDSDHYFPYAMAVYSWKVILFAQPLRGCRKVDCCCGCCMKSNRDVEGAPPLTPRTTVLPNDDVAMRNALLCRNCDIIEINVNNNLFQPTYLVAADYDRGTVVVSIRGTLSFQDALTDAIAVDAPLPPLDSPPDLASPGGSGTPRFGRGVEQAPDLYAHDGMVRCAGYVGRQVQSLLVDLIENGQTRPGMRGPVTGFGLMIVGHSLGGGTATLLTWLLKPRWPAILCLAYSPPSVMSPAASERLRDCVTSVLLYKDLVPRLCLRNMQIFTQRLLQCMAESDASKARVFREAFLCGGDILSLHLRHNTPLLEGETQDRIQTAVKYDNLDSSQLGTGLLNMGPSGDSLHPSMYMGGRVVVLERNPLHAALHPRAQGLIQEYSARWGTIQEFEEISVSPCMLWHHMPHVLGQRLTQVAEALPGAPSSSSAAGGAAAPAHAARSPAAL